MELEKKMGADGEAETMEKKKKKKVGGFRTMPFILG